MNSKIIQPEEGRTSSMNIADDSEYRTYDVFGMDVVLVECQNNSGVDWGTGRILPEFTNIGEMWGNLPSGAITAYSATGFQTAITLGGLIRRMRLRVSAENASAASIQLCVTGVF